jgi:hypothetical protein
MPNLVVPDDVGNIISNEFVVVLLLSRRHGLQEQAEFGRHDQEVDYGVVLHVIPCVGCQARRRTPHAISDLRAELFVALV